MADLLSGTGVKSNDFEFADAGCVGETPLNNKKVRKLSATISRVVTIFNNVVRLLMARLSSPR
jgi:hypothetical protein